MPVNDQRLDDAIDRAVTRMMSVDADPALRARVLASLDRPPRPMLTWARVAVAGTAASLVLVLAFLQPWATRRTTAPQTAVSGQPAPPAAVAAPAPAPVAPAVVQVHRAAPPRHRRVSPAVAPVDEEPESPVAGIRPLAQPELSAIESIEPAAIDPRAVTIAPLAEIREVHVEPLPLTPPGRI